MAVRAGREFLAVPGPTTVPDEVLRAMHRPAVDIYSGSLEQLKAHDVGIPPTLLALVGEVIELCEVRFKMNSPAAVMAVTESWIPCAHPHSGGAGTRKESGRTKKSPPSGTARHERTAREISRRGTWPTRDSLMPAGQISEFRTYRYVCQTAADID